MYNKSCGLNGDWGMEKFKNYVKRKIARKEIGKENYSIVKDTIISRLSNGANSVLSDDKKKELKEMVNYLRELDNAAWVSTFCQYLGGALSLSSYMNADFYRPEEMYVLGGFGVVMAAVATINRIRTKREQSLIMEDAKDFVVKNVSDNAEFENFSTDDKISFAGIEVSDRLLNTEVNDCFEYFIG